MKKYLKDLEAELKKLNISDEDIAEILEDHKEMLKEASEEGITDDEIALKFGDPDKLAKALYEDLSTEETIEKPEPVYGTESLQGYELIHSFPIVEDLQVVNISLVSEDVIYFPYEGESIEVYCRGKYKEEEYSISLKQGTFSLLKSKGKPAINFFGKKVPDFGVRVPASKLDSFKLNLVSGDGKIEQVHAQKGIDFKTVSGDLNISEVHSLENVTVSVVSGDINIKDIEAKGFEGSMVSGDLALLNAKFEEPCHVGTVSGDASFKNTTFPSISFNAVSGDFNGNEVYCDFVTFKSVSGDFKIENSNKDHVIEIRSKKSLSGKVTIN